MMTNQEFMMEIGSFLCFGINIVEWQKYREPALYYNKTIYNKISKKF